MNSLRMKIITGSLSLLLTTAANAFSYTMEFTEAELQLRLDAIMPLQKKTSFAQVEVSDPVLDLFDDENRIGVTANLGTTLLGGLHGKGSVQFSGSLFYEPLEGAFYIRDLQILSIAIKGLPEQTVARLRPLAETLIAKALAKRPVYVLQDQTMQQKLTKATLQSVEVAQEKLRLKFKAF